MPANVSGHGALDEVFEPLRLYKKTAQKSRNKENKKYLRALSLPAGAFWRGVLRGALIYNELKRYFKISIQYIIILLAY